MSSDVWGNPVSNDLSRIAKRAIAGHKKSQNYLKKIWPECSWQTIKERIVADGSTWYVFWMDGVNQHRILRNEGLLK